MSREIQTRAQSAALQKQDPVDGLIDKALPKLREAASRYIDITKFARIAVGTIKRTPKLAQCTETSLLLCLLDCAAMGLLPTGKRGGAYMIPYGTEATLVPDYRGLMWLAEKGEIVRRISAHAVHANDLFKIKLGDSPSVAHEPTTGDEMGDFIGAYSIAWLPDEEEPEVEWMTKRQIDMIRARSKASGAGPWKTDYEPMAIKTVIKRQLSRMPVEITPELERAMDVDNRANEINVTPSAQRPALSFGSLPAATGSSPEPKDETESRVEEPKPVEERTAAVEKKPAAEVKPVPLAIREELNSALQFAPESVCKEVIGDSTRDDLAKLSDEEQIAAAKVLNSRTAKHDAAEDKKTDRPAPRTVPAGSLI